MLRVNDGDILWHYTKGDSILNIVQSGKLNATHVSCLNDGTEIRYGAKLLRDGVLEIAPNSSCP
jgi:hypothetical protein